MSRSASEHDDRREVIKPHSLEHCALARENVNSETRNNILLGENVWLCGVWKSADEREGISGVGRKPFRVHELK